MVNRRGTVLALVLLATVLVGCRGLVYVEVVGDMTSGVVFSFSLSDDKMQPLNVDRVRVSRFDRSSARWDTLWEAVGAASIGSLHYGEKREDLEDTVGPLPFVVPSVYRIEVVGNAVRRPLVSGARYFLISEAGTAKSCDACDQCAKLDGVTEFGLCAT